MDPNLLDCSSKENEGGRGPTPGIGGKSAPFNVADLAVLTVEHPANTQGSGISLQLSHPNIIMLEGFVEDVSNDIIWLVFPWGDNGNLKDFVASRDWEIPERIHLVRLD